MIRHWIALLMFTASGIVVAQQSPSNCVSSSPKDVVSDLWTLATQGELLTPTGFDKANRSFFAQPKEQPKPQIDIVSNYWGPPGQDVKGDRADVTMGFIDLGRIDQYLKYIPPKETKAIKTGMLYHLSCAPTHYPSYKPDGDRLAVDKILTGPSAWQIEGSLVHPFATVNTVLRYVLEKRAETTNSEVKKNADESIARLLQLH